MKALAKIFTNRWFLAFLGLTALGLVIWFVGPIIGIADSRPLETVNSRIFTILAILLCWLLLTVFRLVRSQQSSNDIAQGIVESQEQATPDVAGEADVKKLGKQFDDALGLLKRTRGKNGRLNLYELPWYVIVGPPGSGKTTALVNSGLHFPLAEQTGNEALRGVGGTRNCDWWFTDEAILLDTAGRYVSQDSDSSVDRAEWHGFLDLLKKHRKRRPINGVLMAVSIGDVLQMSPSERERQVASIRERIQELYQKFGIRVPIYVLLTKADLLAGFVEFFEDLSREEREQVWGMTFPVDDLAGSNPLEQFDNYYEGLLGRLNERVLSRVHQDRDLVRRGLIYDFPAQVANARPALYAFLNDVFRGSTYEQNPLLRGVYFTSGTQEGSPIDRLMGSVSRNFGFNLENLPAFRGQGKSFFVTRLLRDLVFPEAELAGANRSSERRRALAQAGVVATVLLVAGLAIAGWVVSYFNNNEIIDESQLTTTELESKLDGLDSRSTIDDLLPALNQLRDFSGQTLGEESPVAVTTRLGLYQGEKIERQAQSSYRRLLVQQLLPRLMLDLEQQLARRGQPSDFRYEALKRYLMLDSKAHYDSAAILEWMDKVWEGEFAGSRDEQAQQNLFYHVEALFAKRPEPLPIPLDENLIEEVRSDLIRTSFAERAYGRIKRAPVKKLKGFSIAAAVGENAPLVFARRSGLSLRKAMPPLFTRDGYQQVFLPESARIAANLLDESWVLGIDEASIGDTVAIASAVKDRYYEDFVNQYEELLLDLTLAPFGTPEQGANILRLLSADDSPLLKLIAAVKEETELERIDVDIPGGDKAAEAIAGSASELDSVLGRTRVGSGINRAVNNLNRVQSKFRVIGDLLPEGGGGPMDRLITILAELYEFMNLVASQGDALPSNLAEGGEKTIRQLESAAKGKPKFVEDLMMSVAEQTSQVAFGGVSNYINQEWNTRAAGYCRDAIADRYPISRASRREIQLQDFADFFGPGGIVDEFFDTYLKEYVNTSSRPWKVQAARSSSFSLDASALRQFERARSIRDVFFKGGATPAVSFELTPIRLDNGLNEFSLELGGKRIVYRSGPRFPEAMHWPGADTSSVVRIQMLPPGPSGRSSVEERGPWAWFRVLDRGKIRPSSKAEHFLVDFSIEGRVASYELAARSAFNPFALQALSEFRCPKSL